MSELCRASGQQMRLFTALWGLWLSESLIHTGSAEQRRLTLELLKLANEAGLPEQLLQAHHAAWTTRLDQGEFAECWCHAQEGISRYDPDTHQLHVFRYGGHDPGVCCRIHGALALWALGHPQQALAQSDQGIALARQLGHPVSLAFAHLFSAFLRQRLGDPAAAEGFAQATVVVCREHELLPHMINAARLIHGWALVAKGHAEEGCGEMDRALGALLAVGAHKRLPYYLALHASAVAQLGQLDEGLRLLADALERARSTGEHWWDAEILRLRGDLLRHDGRADSSEIEKCYRQAVATAQAQQAKALELRAATSLAGLWRDEGSRREAYDLLAPIYGWFTEGFDTADLKDAKALLDALA